MGIFGWSYPPGAANDPSAPYNQETPPCEVCGHNEFDCICPECPVCETSGDPHCYETGGHGLQRTQAQIDGRAALDELIRKQAEADRAEGEYWSHPDRQREAAEMEQYWRDLAKHERGES